MLVIPSVIAEQLCQLCIYLMRAECLADSVCIVFNKIFACLLLFANRFLKSVSLPKNLQIWAYEIRLNGIF